MLRSLYARLLAFQVLLIFLGAMIFWALTGKLALPEPMAMLGAGLLWVALASIVLGVLLHPVDELLLALRRAAHGEPIPPLSSRAPDLAPIAEALARWAGAQHLVQGQQEGLRQDLAALKAHCQGVDAELLLARTQPGAQEALGRAQGHLQAMGQLLVGLEAKVGGL